MTADLYVIAVYIIHNYMYLSYTNISVFFLIITMHFQF